MRKLRKRMSRRRSSGRVKAVHKRDVLFQVHLFFLERNDLKVNRKLFKNGLAALGGEISDKQLENFSVYSALLKEWNEKMNLTAITDDDGIAVKHFLDSILPLYHIEIPHGAALADIGTGAGFPGLPIKLMRPDLNITLIDSLQKRINFLNTVCNNLNLENISCIHGRAEEIGQDKTYREMFDVAASRAVANLKVLCEYCLPLVKVGGIFIALKSENISDELSDAKAMIGSLGGAVESITEAPLPESDIVRKLVLIRKERPTPPQFPRRPNKIK